MPAPTLRRATEDDIAFIMETERLPGYERTVGRFEEDEHRAHLADPTWRYLVHPEMGLALLHGIGSRDGNLCLRRFIVTKTSSGYGSALLPLVLSHVFEETATHRLWLHHVKENTKAAKLYARFGFLHEGIEREAGLRPDGSRFDLVNLSLLRPEWASRRG
ncbi:GNAT family N-acetyltransferase [Rhizobium sp. AG855]|uniref:GNAT family N-acetyltransferase n=1 Tax=Rhizobium sp. AG855 TaxID=2183898 RepID=UPI000E7547BD|nr:GNAT family N-acetyltransferase [Rhizobium sp. AG855]RKE85290.1 acetyltransferase (GNAT) family protein [Rhizobium sp. AG855]